MDNLARTIEALIYNERPTGVDVRSQRTGEFAFLVTADTIAVRTRNSGRNVWVEIPLTHVLRLADRARQQQELTDEVDT